MRGRTRVVLVVITLSIAIFVAWPAPIEPLAWSPAPARPLEGPFAPNEELLRAKRIDVGGVGPESLALASDGVTLYTGLEDGRVIALEPEGRLTSIASTDGRPLGMELDAGGDLIACDPRRRRLLRITPQGDVSVLGDEAGGAPLGFCDDVAIASDGRVYFSDASAKFVDGEHLLDLLEARPHGRLLRFDPASKRVEVLLDELYFANGVALAPDESFVLVTETYRYRIRRYWLAGERAGSSDVLVEDLPGFPDNVTATERGTYWLALYTLRKPLLDEVLHPRPWLKGLLSKQPAFLWPKPQDYALVVEIDERGRALRSFHDPSGEHLRFVTSAIERDGKLYLGTLTGEHVGVLELAR